MVVRTLAWISIACIAGVAEVGAAPRARGRGRHGPPVRARGAGAFFLAWSYRLGKPFNLPLLGRSDLGELVAFQLRREGMKVSLGP